MRSVWVCLLAPLAIACGGITTGEGPRKVGGDAPPVWKAGDPYPRGAIAARSKGDTDGIAILAPEPSTESDVLTTLVGSWDDLRCDAAAFDRDGSLYVLCVQHGHDPSGRPVGPPNRIAIFAPGAAEHDAPVRVISGAQTGLAYLNLTSLFVDDDGFIYVATDECENSGAVLVFEPGATGDVAPVRVIGGVGSEQGCTVDVAVNGRSELYVGNANGGPVLVYPRSANGNVPPTRRIGGRRDFGDSGAILLTTEGEVIVGDIGDVKQLVVYAPDAREGDAPRVSIPTNGSPEGLGFDIRGRLVVSVAHDWAPATLEFVNFTTMTTELVLTDIAGASIAVVR